MNSWLLKRSISNRRHEPNSLLITAYKLVVIVEQPSDNLKRSNVNLERIHIENAFSVEWSCEVVVLIFKKVKKLEYNFNAV